ncbi:hypothetical protein Ddc_16511 [Ditylenchus destructor]|nr:hypothetical protein Ddc_16511 [Ditylenchus destructor]
MRRSAEMLENEDQEKPTAKKNRSDDKITNIITIDNGTIVQVFKYLGYCGLAKNSLVSKRFRDLISSHRHKLALLYVNNISITTTNIDVPWDAIKIFNKELSPEEYNEWVIRNNYSKQVQLEDHVVEKQSSEYDHNAFYLRASAASEDLSLPQSDLIFAFFALPVVNHENWPLFQHFVRLLTDPFIYIRSLTLTSQNGVLNLLATAMNPVHNRLQCDELVLNLDGKVQNLLCWIKKYVRCNRCEIYEGNDDDTNYDKELIEFLVIGGQCTSKVNICHYDFSNAVVDLVQKIMDLKSCDENQIVECIQVKFTDERIVDLLKHDYTKFIVKEEEDDYDDSSVHAFEFVNSDIGKKLQLTAKFFDNTDFSRISTLRYRQSYILFEITNL